MTPSDFVVTLVTDRRLAGGADAVLGLARRAAEAGVDVIQVREKDLSDAALCALSRAVVAAIAGTPARVHVNGRPDVAEAAGAHGVQLPEDGLPVVDVKRAFPRLVVGASRHDRAGAIAAAAAGADFVLVGPVFPTPGKEERALGLDGFAAIARGLRVPVHAVGGITSASARGVREAGAAGVAAIRAFVGEPVAAAVAGLRR